MRNFLLVVQVVVIMLAIYPPVPTPTPTRPYYRPNAVCRYNEIKELTGGNFWVCTLKKS